MKIWLRIIIIFAFLYVGLMSLLYFNQEKLLFFPEKLNNSHIFKFNSNFQEITIKTLDYKQLHALYFRAEDFKGVIYFLHGNGGSLHRWGHVAETYTSLGFDVLILDYRGFGKSQGKIKNLNQLYADVQLGYDWLKSRYEEQYISIMGYSLGTGLAAHVAATNHPQRLILHAPYYSIEHMMNQRFAIVPNFVLEYNIQTAASLETVKCPVYIFHGVQDKTIPIAESYKLKSQFPDIQLIELNNQGHNNMINNEQYQIMLEKILMYNLKS